MAGLKVWADGRGFHRPSQELTKEFRKELLAAELGNEATLKRIYSLLLISFSNQAIIMDALGELQKEGQEMTGAVNNESAAISALTDAVNSGVDIEQQAVNLLATMENQMKELQDELAAAGTTVDNSPALAALTSTLSGGTQALADALTAAGTPVDVPPVTSPTPPASDPTAGTGDDGSSSDPAPSDPAPVDGDSTPDASPAP